MPEIGETKRDSRYRKSIWLACMDCGKERWVQVIGGKPRNLRCCRCSSKLRIYPIGCKSTSWKGGRKINGAGYILIWIAEDDFFYSMTNSQGYVLEHRLVVAKALGRCLQPWEIVHHKGARYPQDSIENRQDNRYPKNLELTTSEDHCNLQYKGRMLTCPFCKNKIKISPKLFH